MTFVFISQVISTICTTLHFGPWCRKVDWPQLRPNRDSMYDLYKCLLTLCCLKGTIFSYTFREWFQGNQDVGLVLLQSVMKEPQYLTLTLYINIRKYITFIHFSREPKLQKKMRSYFLSSVSITMMNLQCTKKAHI